MATIPVKYMHSGMAGAPALNGTVGAMIAVLDACLINGFGLKTVDSLVVASNVATMTISTGHSFEVGSVSLISGVTGALSALNGEWRVTETTTNTVTFDAPGIANGTAAGTITTKVAPLGWSKPYGTGNYAAYKSTDPAALGHYLRVDDTDATNARVRGFETMTTVDNGTGLYPTDAQISGGGYWRKSSTADSTSRNWAVIGDGRFFYLWCVPMDPVSVTSQGTFYWFGDHIPASSISTFESSIGCRNAANLPYASSPFYTYDTSYTWAYCSRSFTGIGGSTRVAITSEAHLFQTGMQSGEANAGQGLLYPNPADNGLYLCRTLVMEGATTSNLVFRGVVPGTYYLPHRGGFVIASRDVIDGQNDLAGRRLMALRFGYGGAGTNSAAGNYGVGLIDVSGPWR